MGINKCKHDKNIRKYFNIICDRNALKKYEISSQFYTRFILKGKKRRRYLFRFLINWKGQNRVLLIEIGKLPKKEKTKYKFFYKTNKKEWQARNLYRNVLWFAKEFLRSFF